MLNRTAMRVGPVLVAVALSCAAGAQSASAAVTHTVRRGETLTSIAAQDGLSVTQLAAANGLSTTSPLLAGAELVIPAQGALTSAAPSAGPTGETSEAAPAQAAAPTTASGGYVVPLGTTLSAIAARFGTTPSALAAANGISVNGVLLAGSRLDVPSAGVPATAAATTAAPAAPAPAPASQFVSPSQVGAIAAQAGVPAPLAEAVADQESGFNNAEVSATGASGVMQIEPGTWQDISRVDGLGMAAGSAVANVQGGVAWLRSLLAATGGDQSEAIAAYYQGLQSVRLHGMYADTQRYVADVQSLEARFGG